MRNAHAELVEVMDLPDDISDVPLLWYWLGVGEGYEAGNKSRHELQVQIDGSRIRFLGCRCKDSAASSHLYNSVSAFTMIFDWRRLIIRFDHFKSERRLFSSDGHWGTCACVKRKYQLEKNHCCVRVSTLLPECLPVLSEFKADLPTTG